MKNITLILIALCTIFVSSCGNEYAIATPGFYKPTSPADPEAEFGIFVKRGEKLNPPAVEAQK